MDKNLVFELIIKVSFHKDCLENKSVSNIIHSIKPAILAYNKRPVHKVQRKLIFL